MQARETMFVGRENELRALEDLYKKKGFQMLVLYGRRRVGKTMLVERFAQDKRAITFTAQLQADADNLADFSRTVFAHFDMPGSMPSFASWSDAFDFLARQGGDERLLVVLDEFPYACRSNPGLPSALQVSIDKVLKTANIMLVLCGSNQGFMENDVLGEKSPLYGRATSQLKLKPFDFFDAVRMMPPCSSAEKLSYYASLGGTPYYLASIDYGKSYLENMADLYFARTGRMFDAPASFMRQELREPAVFNSLLRALAAGANKRNEIASHMGMPSSSVGFYLDTLMALDIVERVVPFGEPARSRRGLYRIKDPAFAFWYRFVVPYVSAIENGSGTRTAERLLTSDRLPEYEGHQFETICQQWVVRQTAAREFSVEATVAGSWWGTDPVAREQADIDVVAADMIEKRLAVGECKWRENFNVRNVVETLRRRAQLLSGFQLDACYVFSKTPVNAREEQGLYFMSLDEMMRVVER